ncbi:MAG: cell envelope integrity protein CreD [Pseudomonadota bacterium]
MGKLLNAKLFALAMLALVLIFAIAQVEWKVNERSSTRDAAVQSIADQYARSQHLVGPLLWVKCKDLSIPFEADANGVGRPIPVRDCSRVIRPVYIDGQGRLDVTERYRGLYKARVYVADLQLHAVIPSFRPEAGQIIENAALIFGVSDPRGLKSIRIATGDGRDLSVLPGIKGDQLKNGFHVILDPSRLSQPMDLSMHIEIAGSGRLELTPVASDNDISLSSSWPHPSFSGGFLPETRAIDAAGFKARWRINDFATGGDQALNHAQAVAFGVSLIDPVDAYRQTDRAVRYGFLFVLLTLGGFFLFEIIKRKPVHPLQYMLIGAAVVLFFLLLLALSEHIAFIAAYLVAASACVLLIVAYGRTLVGSWAGAGMLGGGYAALYAGLYMLLLSEDNSLLMGAWLIFGLLALTMWLTRKLDWNAIGRAGEDKAA